MAGLYEGAFVWLGSYEECVGSRTDSTSWYTPTANTLQHDFNGKHCTINWYYTEVSNHMLYEKLVHFLMCWLLVFDSYSVDLRIHFKDC